MSMRRSRLAVASLVAMAAVAGCSSSSSPAAKQPAPATTSQAATAPATTSGLGPEGIAVQHGTPLASLATAATGKTVDGVECNSAEQAAYHIHTHLAIYVDGALRPVTPGIGVVQPVGQQTASGPFYGASTCYYWLHVHTQDGVIHVESPTTRTYTLGQFFAIWGQPLTSNRVGPASGVLTVYVDGKPYTGAPAAIPLGSRENIQIDVGSSVPYQNVDWSQSQL